MTVIALPYLGRQEKYAKLASLLSAPWAMMLDSAGDNMDYNRYDIVCAKPTVTLSFAGVSSEISGAVPDELLASFELAKPLDCMRKILKHFEALQNERRKDIPFQGGWLGYFSYDIGRQLEVLPDLNDDDIQLPQVQMGFYQWALITDHQTQRTNLYNLGLPKGEWHPIIEWVLSCVNQPQAEAPSQFRLTGEWQSNTTKDEYTHAFNRIQDYIHRGDCYQVNFAQRFKAPYSGDVYQAYQRLTLGNQAPFSAYFNFEDHQILSLSPERFIESHQGKVITQPIKGTRPRSSDPIEDSALGEALINSEKDKAENLMIVDLLRNDLSRTAAKGSVKVSELFGHYRFESVHHLISTIESKLASEYDNFDLLETTLPGGSITGAPKIRAMEIIEELEKVRRNLYCGVIAYIDLAGNMDSNICIRTLIAKNSQLYCWAGGGLVADSQLEVEYQETFDKLAKILPLLQYKE